MKINIISISGKGFMCFKDSFIFSISDYEGKTVQIDGKNLDDEKSKSNGSGKSTLLETINWGLFGELCRKNRYKDEVIHKKVSKANIQIIFKIDYIQYKVNRIIERRKTPNLKIWKEEEELLVGSTYQTKQENLELILGMNFVSFQCSIMFGRDFNNFPDLPPYQRAKILSDIRGLDKYLDSSQRAGESSKSMAVLLDQTGRELGIKESKLSEIRTTSFKPAIDQFEKDRIIYILATERMIAEKTELLNKESERVQKEKDKIEQKIEELGRQESETLSRIPDRKEIADRNADDQSSLIQILSKINSIKNRISGKNIEITELSSKGEGPCPFCKQTITGAYLQARINQLGLEIMELNSECNAMQIEEKELRNNMRLDRETIIAIDAVLEKATELKNKIYELQVELAAVNSSSNIQVLESQILELENRKIEKKEEKNPHIEMEEKRKARIKELGTEIRNIREHMNLLQKQMEYFNFWIEGFKKIRMMIFDSMISQLETLAQWYLSQYSSELNIIMTTERETRSGTIKDEFHISIVDTNGDEISYEMYSGGERQKIRLSISRALAQFIREGCGVDFNIVAFDEPNDALDDIGKDTNFETFQELSEKEGKSVLVTDHDSVFKDKFDNNIVIIKENGESSIHVR